MSKLLVFAAAAVVTAPPTDGGTAIMRTTKSAQLDTDTKALDNYFSCLVAANPLRAKAAVRQDPVQRATSKKLRELDHSESECLTSAGMIYMKSTASLYRAGLARSLYIQAYPHMVPKLAEPPPPNLANDAAAVAAASDKPFAAMTIFTRCVASAEPAAADAYVRAEPGSTQETGQLAAMKGHFPACLTTVSSMAIDRQTLRQFLGYSLYVRTPNYGSSK